MQLSRCAQAVVAALGLASILGAKAASAGDVLAEISVRNRERPSTYHGEMFVFPDTIREYSRERFYGWSFRHDLRDGGVRLLEVARARTRGAYLMATDLFADGHFSTMSHTVLMVFPRSPIGRTDLYALSEDRGGYLRLLAPDGSALLVDGGSGAVLPTADFTLGPQGLPGTPPALWHRGLHLVIHAVGKSPFLRSTPVRVVDSQGRSCSLVTDEVFAFGPGPESDVFQFDSDAQFFQYLDRRCPELARAPGNWKTRSPAVSDDRAVAVVAPQAEAVTTSRAATEAQDSPRVGGVLSFLSRLLSNRLWSNRL
jgi:hypothetical protein